MFETLFFKRKLEKIFPETKMSITYLNKIKVGIGKTVAWKIRIADAIYFAFWLTPEELVFVEKYREKAIRYYIGMEGARYILRQEEYIQIINGIKLPSQYEKIDCSYGFYIREQDIKREIKE